MPTLPAFVTQYEILRSQDYVMLTLSTPTGEVIDGRMQTEEVQRIALTHPRFLEFAAAIGQIARNIEATAEAQRVNVPPNRPAQKRRIADTRDEAAPASDELGDWVVRH